jgi:rare lipoprotein A
VVEPGQPVPKGGGTYRVGKPYVVAGRTYYPNENKRYRREGIASWYGDDFHGRLTANGEVYDMEGVSAAHTTLPMPSYARVTNLHNGRSLIVRVNDRGPYHADREIDLSSKAADLLGLRRAGTGRVRVEYVGAASLDGSDDRQLMATLREGGPAPAPSAVRVAAAKPFLPSAPEPVVTHREPVMASRSVRPERSYDSAEDRDPAASVVRALQQPRAAARTLPERSFDGDDDDRELVTGARPGRTRTAARAVPQRFVESDDDEPAPRVTPMRSAAAGGSRTAVLTEPLPPPRGWSPAEALPARRGESRMEAPAVTRGGGQEPRMVWSPGPPPAAQGRTPAYAPAQDGVAVTNGRGLY